MLTLCWQMQGQRFFVWCYSRITRLLAGLWPTGFISIATACHAVGGVARYQVQPCSTTAAARAGADVFIPANIARTNRHSAATDG